jgi:hypothetical protein
MAEEPSGRDFRFMPEYADQIAHANNNWTFLEYYVNSSIWALADVKPALGACMTSQIYTMNGRLSALLSLLKVRRASQKIIDKVNKFAANVRDAQDARNRTAHDMWLLDNYNPGKMGKLRITADKVLKFDIESVEIEQLRADVSTISGRRMEFSAIRQEILAALPTLPEIPPEELHPIAESRSRLRNLASDSQ